jgi:Cu/Ag efflux protein CusF
MSHVARRAAAALLLLLTLALAPLACGAEDPEAPKAGQGVIRGLHPERAAITLEHGPIEGLMSAMTMTFPLADPSLAAGLAVGDAVDFSVKQDGDRIVVTEIHASAAR